MTKRFYAASLALLAKYKHTEDNIAKNRIGGCFTAVADSRKKIII